MNDQKDNVNLTDMIRNLPEHNPPRDLTPLVMEALAPKTVSLWRRLRFLVRTPKIVTITPFKLAGAVAACVLVAALVFQLPAKRFESADQRTNLQLAPVIFSLADDQARSVYLIGSFNGWKPEGYEMKRDDRSSRWIVQIDLPPGEHEYAFLIDDKQAISDPRAIFYKMDGFGSRNSVIYTSAPDENIL